MRLTASKLPQLAVPEPGLELEPVLEPVQAQGLEQVLERELAQGLEQGLERVRESVPEQHN